MGCMCHMVLQQYNTWLCVLQIQTPIRPQSVSLVPTGASLPLDIQINGVSVVPNCSQSVGQTGQTSALTSLTSSMTPAPGLRTYGEPWLLAAQPCKTFVLSTLLGPSVAGPLKPNVVNATGTLLSVPLLLGQGVTAADLAVNSGGKFCRDVQLLVGDTTTANVFNASSIAAVATVVAGAVDQAGLYTLCCTAPNLPAGEHSVLLVG